MRFICTYTHHGWLYRTGRIFDSVNLPPKGNPEIRASIGHIIRKEPHFASKHTVQASTHIRKRANTLRQQASNVSFVTPQIYRHSHEQNAPTIFGSRVSNFLPQGYHHTVVSHEYRHEFGAACISPTSRPSSSPRRGRSASASSPATDSFNPDPDQWRGKVSALLQVFVVHLRIVQNQEYNTN